MSFHPKCIAGLVLFTACLMGVPKSGACDGANIKKLVNTAGWKVPNVVHMRRVAEGQQLRPEGSSFIPTEKMLFELITVSSLAGAENSVSYNSSKWRVGMITRLEAHGRPYAYLLHLVPPRPGAAIPGCPVTVALLDEDGDGLFETYIPFAGDSVTAPEWTK